MLRLDVSKRNANYNNALQGCQTFNALFVRLSLVAA